MKFRFEYCLIIATLVAFSLGPALSDQALTSANATNNTTELYNATAPYYATSPFNVSAPYNITIADVLQEGTALHVVVANNGTTAQDLTGWQLITDNPLNSTYVFPTFALMPMSTATVHTHINNNTATDLYGSGFMWSGTNDVKLFDNGGILVYDYIINNTSMNVSST